MNLDKVAAVLRRRQGVESVDLGLLLGRRFWSAIIGPWLLLVLPILVIIQVVTASFVNIWIALLVGWWLKPLFDRVTLHVLSRSFFGSVPGTRDTVKTVARQWFSWEAVLDLTWRRFSPTRTVVMPVRVLEGARGSDARQRLKSLYGSGGQTMSGWALVSLIISFKWMFYIAVVVLVAVVIPTEIFTDQFDPFDYFFEDAPTWFVTAAVLATTTVATLVVEPFFGAGGFGIYIQQRIDREGWDLELRFRRLVERMESSRTGSAGLLITAGLAALLAALAIAPAPAYAQGAMDDVLIAEPEDIDFVDDQSIDGRDGTERVDWLYRDQIPVDDPQQELDDIMAASPFVSGSETVTEWRWKEREENQQENTSDATVSTELVELLSEIVRVVIWMFAILLAIFLIWKIIRFVQSSSGGLIEVEKKSRWEDELMQEGQTLTVPEDHVAKAVRQRWADGEQREALALLLLSSLLKFEKRHAFSFPQGWTTGRCAREVSDKGAEGPMLALVAKLFAELAWAGRTPAEQQFQDMVRRWEAIFEPTGGTS